MEVAINHAGKGFARLLGEITKRRGSSIEALDPMTAYKDRNSMQWSWQMDTTTLAKFLIYLVSRSGKLRGRIEYNIPSAIADLTGSKTK